MVYYGVYYLTFHAAAFPSGRSRGPSWTCRWALQRNSWARRCAAAGAGVGGVKKAVQKSFLQTMVNKVLMMFNDV